MKNAAADELRVRILDEAAKLFNEKGIRFTMDDLARSLAMSKKTIYTVFKDKRSIMTETIDRFFDDALDVVVGHVRRLRLGDGVLQLGVDRGIGAAACFNGDDQLSADLGKNLGASRVVFALFLFDGTPFVMS